MKKNRLDESFFYSEQAKSLSVGDILTLEIDEINHLTKVFRAQKGDFFQLTDGCGRLFRAQLIELDRKNHQVKLIKLLKIEEKPALFNIKIGFLKGKDLEEVVDTCCQAFPGSIQPLWTEHTQESSSKDHSKLFQRLQVKAITGLKQSKSLWLSQILEPIQFEEAISNEIKSSPQSQVGHSLVQLVLDMDGFQNLKDSLKEQMNLEGANLWFGPEGGLSASEIDQICQLNHSQSLNLGDFRLRAITAPIFTLGYLAGQLNK